VKDAQEVLDIYYTRHIRNYTAVVGIIVGIIVCRHHSCTNALLVFFAVLHLPLDLLARDKWWTGCEHIYRPFVAGRVLGEIASCDVGGAFGMVQALDLRGTACWGEAKLLEDLL
jgi:hypothetical protein